MQQYTDWDFVPSGNYKNYQKTYCTAWTVKDAWVNMVDKCNTMFPTYLVKTQISELKDPGDTCVLITSPTDNCASTPYTTSCYILVYMKRYQGENDFTTCKVDPAVLLANNAADSASFFKTRIGQLLSLAKNEDIFRLKLEGYVNGLSDNRTSLVDGVYNNYKNFLNNIYKNYTAHYNNFTSILLNFDTYPNQTTINGVLNKNGILKNIDCCNYNY